MSTFAYTAQFEHDADAIYALLIDIKRHNRILPFCKSVRVTSSAPIEDGMVEATMEHDMAISRIGLDAAIASMIRYQSEDRTFEMFSRIGEKADVGLLTTAMVEPDGAGSVLHLSIVTDHLPMRYRLLLIEPVVQRACNKFVEKLARRADELARAGNGMQR